ncbi:MAG TPA: ribosome-associated translation inhibitor RaiA [Candidatus Hydrothermia bacterium]|nr:ribosome-associated translation inhibitor RaiA [Candidatus Hydrothermae bacterium]MDD3649248.1 ribosome-associated translation inhibitor RaiA [Candidatus Hydrothermia bacterium]MDD5573081.1 ribosome-associated translation inhibitor RaiA [Candidatus Hydrothermia bacterium]HOK22662.1 ribosome-associated translation inhibitor RaiA [Candidatus Hydrothermia bacterium]HOL23371.1 ribosome-associated translation inhibitor RaiA [Candidatus Hydrothermia bacterium]
MNVNITVKNFEITGALKEYIDKRMKVLNKFEEYIISADLTMEEQRSMYSGTLVVKVKGQTLTAKSTEKDPYILIDALKDRIKQQLVKYEKKLKDRRA